MTTGREVIIKNTLSCLITMEEEGAIIIDPVGTGGLGEDIGVEAGVAPGITEIADIRITMSLSDLKIWEKIWARLISTKKMNPFHRYRVIKGALEVHRVSVTLLKGGEGEEMSGWGQV